MGRPQCLASLRFDTEALVIPLKRADGLVPCETASDRREVWPCGSGQRRGAMGECGQRTRPYRTARGLARLV